MSGYSSYQTGGASIGAGRDGDFNRLSQTVSTNIQKISQNVNSIKRMVSQLGTQADTEDLRQKLHQIQHYTNQLAKDTNKHMKDLNTIPLPTSPSEQRQRKLYKERIMNEFSTALNDFQTAQRKAAEKEKASVKRARAYSATGAGVEEGFPTGSGSEQLISFESERSRAGRGAAPPPAPQQQSQLQIEEDVPIEELLEREKSIRQLESDILDVNQIFKDLGMMVHEQGEVIDSIEANVESASMHVTEGVGQLRTASNYQQRSRRRCCVLVVILCVILSLLSLIIYLATS